MKRLNLLLSICTLALTLYAQNNLAKVDNYGGVYIFTDCTPVAAYETLGIVNFSSSGDSQVLMMGSMPGVPNYGMPGGMMIAASETPQYNEIRNGLIANAVMANRQVEGVLIKILKEGVGQATMIKFEEGAIDKDLAKVNSHQGVLVFTDCQPVQQYTFIGKIKGAGGLSTDYNALRDKLCKKCKQRFKETQGMIPHFVTGGSDSAEAIKF